MSPPNLHSIPPNLNSTLYDKIIFQFTVYYKTPSNKVKATSNAIDLAMDLLLHKLANTGENQLINNLKPRFSANTFVKKLNLHQTIGFLLKFM